MTNPVIEAIEEGFEKAKNLVMGVGSDITAELVKAIHELEPEVIEVIEMAIPVVVAGVEAGTPAIAIAAAVETAALAEFQKQGLPMLESDAIALKGAILARVAATVAGAVPTSAITQAAQEATTTPPTEPEAPLAQAETVSEADQATS